jgi:hypothetical protein
VLKLSKPGTKYSKESKGNSLMLLGTIDAKSPDKILQNQNHHGLFKNYTS